jgi:TP901 family phage tail tape measure protein
VANEVTITVDADTQKASKNVSGMGEGMKKTLKGVAVAGAALTGVAAAASAIGQEYQQATNTIAAGTGATGPVLEGLTTSFRSVWSEVPQDAAAVSAAIADVNTEMGLEGEALEDVTKAFLDVSRAMGEDAQPMIKSVADAMIAMGEPVQNTEKFLDQLTVASQAVGVPMTELADKVVKFGPQLNELGLPLTEATAMIANMEAKGLDAGKMMPGLNTAIKKLTAEGVTDISGGLQDAITSIQNAGTESEGLGIAMDLFGAGAGLRFKDAIDKGALSTDDLIKSMEDSEGTAANLAATTLTMSDKMDVMKNKVKNALTPVGKLATSLGPMVMMVPAIATGIAAMASSQIVATVATHAQAAAMTILNIAMGPIGLIILGIVAAIAAAILIFKNWDKIVLVFQKTWDIVWVAVKKTWDTVWGAVRKVFDTVMGVLDTRLGKIIALFSPFGPFIGGLKLLSENWDKIWTGMKGVVKAVANPIIGIINSVIGAVNGLFDAMRKVELGWAEKKIGKGPIAVTIPGFNFAPFAGLPTIPTIPKLAAGGIVRSPTLAMIGERGPEAVVPLGANGVSGGVTINILGPTYGFDDFERKVSMAIRDGVRRGGFKGILATA